MPTPVAILYNGQIYVAPPPGGVVGAIWTHGSDNSIVELTAAQLDLSGLPTTDPLVNGLPWQDPSVGYAVKVSQGVSPYTPSLDFSDSRNSMYLPLLLP